MPRTSTAYASAYDRSRIQVINLRRTEKRTFVVDWVALIGAESISAVTWYCNYPYITVIASPAITGKLTTVDVSCAAGGIGSLKATITTSGGDKHSQVFEVRVADCPSFPGEPDASAGPESVTASA